MRKAFLVGAVGVALIGGLALGDARTVRSPLSVSEASSAGTGSVFVGLHRISESQYRNSIAQVFGPQIAVAGRFEPESRVDGLLATGSSVLSVTSAGFEGYLRLADTVAAQVVSETNRARLIACRPRSAQAADAACAKTVLSHYGRLLFHRPLTAGELASRVDLAGRAATQAGDFYAGLGKSLASLLTAPEFLFRVEMADRTADGLSLDGYSRAQRISFLLWNAPPDDELLRAAGAGELKTSAGLTAQVDRMMASPQLETGMRAFFADMLQLDRFETLSKDSEIFPNYSERVSASSREETLKTVIDHTLTQDADYRDLLTTRKTFVNRTLASIYQVPYAFKSDWEAYEFPIEAGRSGVLTQATFLSMFSHPGRSSPTIRGVALREIFMCDPTPMPPANVDFSLINDANNPTMKTVRARLLAHASVPTCAACHTRSDPIGLSLENFDSIGQFRKLDNGEPIDASAKIGVKSFVGASALGVILRDDPKIPACVVKNVYAYGAGVKAGDLDRTLVANTQKGFADAGYKLRALLKTVLTDEAFYRLLPEPEAPEPVAAPPARVASARAAPLQRNP